MTNDAERVSDMLRIIAAALNKGPTESANARQGMALRCSQAADIIEAQSKALAEARELLEAIDAEVFLPPQLQELLQAALTPTPENPNG